MSLLSSVVSTGIGTGIEAAFHPLNSLLGTYFQSGDYLRKGTAWRNRPWIQPDAASCFALLNRGLCTEREASSLLSFHGITLRPTAEQTQQVRDDARGVGDVLGARLAEQNRAATALGITSHWWRAIRESQLTVPGISDAIGLRMKGAIDRREFGQIIKRCGGNVDHWDRLYPWIFQPLDVGSLFQAVNRGLLDVDDLSSYLKFLGYERESERDIIHGLREVLPTVSDLVMFGVKDVWDPQAVAQYKLFDDTPPQLHEWAAKQGLFGKSGIRAQFPIPGRPGQTEEREASWADVYWAAHWQPISPHMAHGAFHRFRANRVHRYTNQVPDLQAFTYDQLRLALKTADYPVGDRPTLAALAFEPLRLVDIRRALTTHVLVENDPAYRASLTPELRRRLLPVNRQWAVEQLRDRGLVLEDAEISADLMMAQAQRQSNPAVRQFEARQRSKDIAAVVDSYHNGTIDNLTCVRSLTARGVSEQSANATVFTQDTIIHNDIVRTATAAIRRDYLGGVIGLGATEDALRDAGVIQSRVNTLIAKWTIEHNRTRKTATTERLLRWLKDGLISRDEVLVRLTNIGWSNADQMRLLRDASARETEATVSALERGEIGHQQTARHLRSTGLSADAVDAIIRRAVGLPNNSEVVR